MHEPGFLLFASDATLLGLWGSGLLLLAGIAWFADRRRSRRRRIDAVGVMPWTTVFFLAFFCGLVLLAVAMSGWLRG